MLEMHQKKTKARARMKITMDLQSSHAILVITSLLDAKSKDSTID